MRRSISRSVEIDARPDRVWRELTDTASYPGWNPFIKRLEGELGEGERIEVEIEPPDGRTMTFKPKVTAVEPNRELRWLGHLLVRGLFDGEHRFEIEDLGDGRSRLTQSERFDGVLVRPFGGTLVKTERSFEAMNRALKERAEAALERETPRGAGRLVERWRRPALPRRPRNTIPMLATSVPCGV